MTYTITIFGEGAEVCIGEILQEQYQYWAEVPESDLVSHLKSEMLAGLEVPESAALIESHWTELNDIYHGFVPVLGEVVLKIESDDKSIILEETLDWDLDEKITKQHGTELIQEDTDYPNIYPGQTDEEIFYCVQIAEEKGLLFKHDLVTKDPFKIELLKICIIDVNEDFIGIAAIYYDNVRLVDNAEVETRNLSHSAYVATS